MDHVLNTLPRIELAHLPTPLERLPRLSAELGGPEIWIKRDDCTGLGLGGNKTRKLEFLLGTARAEAVDTVITVGGVQSNHARQTAAACARLGMRCQLILPKVVARRGPDYEQNGNILLDHMFGAEVFIVADEAEVPVVLSELRQQAERDNRTIVFHPPGGSTAVGTLGYVAAVFELKQQMQRDNLGFDRVILAASTGGTLAGLAAGASLAAWETDLHGICVAGDAAKLNADVCRLIDDLNGITPLPRDVTDRVQFDDTFLGDGYGLPSAPALEAIELCSRLEGLLLDPVYTAKAMAALISMSRQGEAGAGRVLFWHTGGAPSLFAYKDDLLAGSAA